MIRRRLKQAVFSRVGWFPYYGARVHFPRGSFLFALACQQGTYEHGNVRILLNLVKPDTYFFDVGANIGLMALPILLGQPRCRVVSFEPSPGTTPFLRRTAEESRFRDRWQIVEKAVGDSPAELDFHVARAGMGAFDGFYDTRRAGVDMRTVKVPVTTLDEEWSRLGAPEVSAMKIDVEGAELEVIRGARRCIAANKPRLLVEWNFPNSSAAHKRPGELLAVAEEIGYRVYCMPHMVRVTDEAELTAQMLFSEDFLLCPCPTP